MERLLQLIQTLFTTHPYLSMLSLGLLTLLTASVTYGQLRLGIRYFMSKRKLRNQLQQQVLSPRKP
ncbi:hypothetical protein WDW89_03470 [Deltaproteobacteria bacterium TL4]